MSSTELDLPVLVTPEQIRRREFVTTRRGYDVEQVRDYLQQLSQQVEQMESLLRSAKLRAGAAERAESEPQADPYERLSQRFAEVLRATDREADRIRREAKDEAERTLREARADADRIRLDAQSRAEQAREEAERALREARTQADRTIAGLATRRDVLVEQLAAMQERLMGVAHELEAAIERPEDDEELLESLRAAATDAGAADPTSPTDVGLAPADTPADSPGDTVHETPADTGGETAAGMGGEPQETAPPAGPVEPVDTTTGVVNLVGPETGVEELWASADPDELRIPEIPPLDLDWEDDTRG